MRRRDQIAGWAIIITLAFAVLAIGSSTRWTALVTAMLGVGCGALYVTSRRELVQIPPLLQLVALAAGITLLQILPMPSFIVGILSPAKLELVRANAAALGESAPTWVRLSVDPPGSLVALATLVGYFGAGLAAIRVGATRGGRLLLARGVVGVASVVALSAVLAGVAGLERVFGLYEPQAVRDPQLLAPLLNPNHLAGYLAVAAPVGVGLAITSRATARLLWVACTLLLVVVTLLAESRTGVVSLAVGLAVVAAFVVPTMLRERRSARTDRAGRIAIGVIATTLLVGGLYVFGAPAVEELAETDVDELTGKKSKGAIWSAAAPLVSTYRFAGVGRGAFEPAFTGEIEGRFTFSHVENEYLQAVVDWGVPAAIGMLILLVMAGKIAARRASGGPLHAGLFAGLIAAAVHHLADFAIELPGVAMLVLVAFAALSRGELRKTSSSARVSPLLLRGGAVVLGALVIASAALWGASAREEVDALAADDPSTSPAALSSRALRSWLRHPRDYRAAGQVAVVLSRAGDKRAFAVMNRALSMKSNDASLQHAAARLMLLSQRREQAVGHYRLAIRHERDPTPLIRELHQRFPDPVVAAAGLPSDSRRLRRYFTALRTIEAPDLTFAYAQRMAAVHPGEGHVQIELARAALALEKYEVADRAGQLAWDKLGSRVGALWSARARMALSRPRQAARAIEAARDRGHPPATRKQRIAELRLLGTARNAFADHDGARAALEQALELAGQGATASAIMGQLAETHENLGNPNQAGRYRERARTMR